MDALVLSVVQEFIDNGQLFTALDVSNKVKQADPSARHREVRDVVRKLFPTDIQAQGWDRTPITVNLANGTQETALLYHPLSDSWDLDVKYDTQKRTAVGSQSIANAQATLAQAQASYTAAQPAVTPVAPAPQPQAVLPVTPMPNARTLWDQLFATQTSLFPRK